MAIGVPHNIGKTPTNPARIGGLTITTSISVNKAQLINAISERTEGISKKDIDLTIDALTHVITEAVANKEKVTLVGFGSFEPRFRKEREGRNPANGEAVSIPAKTVPSFSAGKAFKEIVANRDS